jgi:hypothetical protein
MSRSTPVLSLILLALLSSPPARAQAADSKTSDSKASDSTASGSAASNRERPLIERAAPDPVKRARISRWRLEFARQSPALTLAIDELVRERRWWHGSSGRRRCARAAVALARVDRASLFAAADYRLVSAAGRALDELAAAVHACHTRRYVELDYRLGLAGAELERLARLTAPPAVPLSPRR